MTEAESRLASKRAYGGVEQTKELQREERSFVWLEQARQDVRFSARSLIHSPGFTITAVLTLALGIGANSAIFSVINAVLLRPLPYEDPDRLVQITENVPAAESFTGRSFRLPAMSPQDASQLSHNAKSLVQVALYLPSAMVLTEPTKANVVPVAQLSPQMLPVLGVQPIRGRFFRDTEDKAGADQVVVISHRAWLKYFGADSAVLGQSVVLDNRKYSVIGVMPRNFDFPDSRTEFWKPLIVANASPGQLAVFPVLARLNPNYSIQAASAEVNEIFRHLRRRMSTDSKERMEIKQVKEAQAAISRPALLVLAAAVGFVLLIACANVANLLLARSTRRQRENAIRASLGAGRGRLVRQSLVESLLLAILGGASGLLFAIAADQLLLTLWPTTVNGVGSTPRFEHIGIDTAVFSFTLFVSVLTGLLFGLVPAIRISKTQYMEVIKQGTPFASSARYPFRGYRALGGLVVAESAMAFVLLIGAGLLIRSFMKLSSVDPGFTTKDVLTFQVASAPDARRNLFNDELAGRLKALPGIQAAGYGELLPLELQSLLIRPFRVPGAPQPKTGVAVVQPRTLEGSWDYFRAVGFRLVSGRWFQASDGPSGHRVMLVNQTLALRFFGNENPIGKSVYSLGRAPWEIVGMVQDVRQSGLTSEAEPQFFLEYHQLLHALPEWATDDIGRAYSTRMYFAVRTSRNLSELTTSIRQLVGHLDKNVAMNNVSPLEAVVSNSIDEPAFYAGMVGMFSLVAIVLASIGLYGVISYAVTQRTQEIGIRMALGAERRDVLMLVMGQGTKLAGLGIVLGIAGAFVLTRYLQNMLFGLTPLDLETFVAVSIAFAAIATLASYMPARRATNVDPLVSLRYEGGLLHWSNIAR